MICDQNKLATIFHENMRSVLNVKNELIRSTSMVDFDVLTMTETWLNDSHHNNQFMSPMYKVFRKDRLNSNVNASRGGEFSLQ